MFPSPDDDNEILFDKFVQYQERKLLVKIEDDLYPEYDPVIMEIIEDRDAYKKMILETIYYEYHFPKKYFRRK